MTSHRSLDASFTAFLLAPLGLIVFLSAQGISHLAMVNLATAEVRASLRLGALTATGPPQGAAPFHATSAAAILARNPFDSTAAAPGDLPTPAVAEAPSCEGVRVLAIVASSDADWSFAAFMEGREPRALIRRRGGEIGTKTVAFIGRDRVWLTSGTEMCEIAMFGPKGEATHSEAQHSEAQTSSVDPLILRGIRRVSPTELQVDRGVVERILENQAEMVGTTRVAPALEQGKVAGYRLLGVRPDSLLGVLGVQNGDVLRTINGFDMTNPERALEAYARLRTADHLVVRVQRGGKDVSLDYDIR